MIGGGLLGAAITRELTRRGAQVVVGSRTARPHAGLWRHFELGKDRLAGLLAGGRPHRIWVAVSPAPGEPAEGLYGEGLTGFLREVTSAGVAATVCLPGGVERAPSSSVTLLRFGPLYGAGDRWLFPLATALREGHSARYTRGIPACRPLLVDDAARAAVAMAEVGGVHRLCGPDVLTMAQIAAALTDRFPGTCAPHLWRRISAAERTRLFPPADHDDWDATSAGARIGVSEWIERLPGPRRRR